MDGYIGMIMPWAGTWAPRNWTFCDGTILQIAQNQALYSIIGNNYGGNAASGTFALPDLRCRMILHPGTNPSTGENVVQFATFNSTQQMTIPVAALPPHTHPLNQTIPAAINNLTVKQPVNTSGATQTGPGGAYPAVVRTSTQTLTAYSPTATDGQYLGNGVASGNVDITLSGATGNAGGTGTLRTWPSYAAIPYIICIFGYYPDRD